MVALSLSQWRTYHRGEQGRAPRLSRSRAGYPCSAPLSFFQFLLKDATTLTTKRSVSVQEVRSEMEERIMGLDGLTNGFKLVVVGPFFFFQQSTHKHGRVRSFGKNPQMQHNSHRSTLPAAGRLSPLDRLCRGLLDSPTAGGRVCYPGNRDEMRRVYLSKSPCHLIGQNFSPTKFEQDRPFKEA